MGGLRLAALLAVAGLLRLPTLGQPLTEAHSFRQTQTAFPALIYAQEGIDLLRPQVPVLGEPWVLPFEFPLVQALAAMGIQLGLPVEVAMRGLALASFLAGGFLLWLILRRYVSDRVAIIGATIFLFSPFSLLWSRTSLVEYEAVAASLAFMLGALEWSSRGGRRWLGLALIGGGLAALIKISTALFWLAPVILLRRRAPMVVAALAATLGLAWTSHADAVKAASEASRSLTSAALVPWNFGGDRLSLDTWRNALWPAVRTCGMLLLPVSLLVVRRPERVVWMWFAVALIGPVLLFTNLYATHDYYSAAIAPAVAALVAGGVDTLIARLPKLRSGLVVLAILSVVSTWSYWGVAYTGADPDSVMQAASIIREVGPGAAVRCSDWSPAGFFYAGTRGYIAWRGEDPPIGYVSIADARACPGRRQ